MEFFQTTPLSPQSGRPGAPGNCTGRAGPRGHFLPGGIRRETRGQADGVPPRGPSSNGGRVRGGEADGLLGDEGREGGGEEAAGQPEAGGRIRGQGEGGGAQEGGQGAHHQA